MQNINLYQQVEGNQNHLSGSVLIALVVVLVVALGGLHVYQKVEVDRLVIKAKSAKQRQSQAQQRLDNLQANYVEPKIDERLQRQFESIHKDVSHARRVVEKLRSGTFGNTAGLSGYLQGIARQHVDGTWLTGIHIRDGGAVLGVKGRTLAPELIPVFVQRLAQEDTFMGKSFSGLTLEALPEENDEIEFLLHTEGYTTGDETDG